MPNKPIPVDQFPEIKFRFKNHRTEEDKALIESRRTGDHKDLLDPLEFYELRNRGFEIKIVPRPTKHVPCLYPYAT